MTKRPPFCRTPRGPTPWKRIEKRGETRLAKETGGTLSFVALITLFVFIVFLIQICGSRMILSAIPFRLIFPMFNFTPLDSFVLDFAVAFFSLFISSYQIILSFV